jgi:hypothetical protein
MGGSASETRPIICWCRHLLPLTTRFGELLRIDVVHEQQRLRSATRIAYCVISGLFCCELGSPFAW